MIVTPVGPYFKGGAKPITICVSDFDRAAPHGTGHIKAGLNYAMSLHAHVTAHAAGYDENMFLDPETRTYVEETGGANFIFITKDRRPAEPTSSSSRRTAPLSLRSPIPFFRPSPEDPSATSLRHPCHSEVRFHSSVHHQKIHLLHR